MTNIKKVFLTFFLAGFLLFLFSGFIFAQEVEVDYPQIPGGPEPPKTVKTFLPKYIQYLFSFALMIAGLVAFASLVYGGFRYLTSAGSPVAMADARSQIFAGILGLVILLASFLILNTINPQLTILQIGKMEFEKGVILYAGGGCPGGDEPDGEEGKDFLRVRRSLSSLGDFNDKTQTIYLYNSSDELEVFLYFGENYNGDIDNPDWKSIDHAADTCAGAIAAKSIILYWKIPGVYLYETPDCTSPPEPRLFVADSGNFGDFRNKAQSMKILPWIKMESHCDFAKPGCKTADACLRNPAECLIQEPTVVVKFGAILHEQSNFEGDAQIFLGGGEDPKDLPPLCIPLGPKEQPCPNGWPGPYCQRTVGDRASAIHLFKQNLHGIVSGDGVTLYANFNFDEEDGKDSEPPCVIPPSGDPVWVDGSSCEVLANKKASSIRVDGTFIAVLFREDGRGQVFKPPGDIRLKDDHIGDNEAKYMLVIPTAREEED